MLSSFSCPPFPISSPLPLDIRIGPGGELAGLGPVHPRGLVGCSETGQVRARLRGSPTSGVPDSDVGEAAAPAVAGDHLEPEEPGGGDLRERVRGEAEGLLLHGRVLQPGLQHLGPGPALHTTQRHTELFGLEIAWGGSIAFSFFRKATSLEMWIYIEFIY